ncbi:uncharacterized protein G2W53_014147 [Senna tora]|uniref:Uncharacterized protein n=1 Tax=Senna tora TaxID=362788 RepID=A0A834WSZ1_9FABA|nr:uncharacterized protein G2W53_014147 [Senna tora]
MDIGLEMEAVADIGLVQDQIQQEKDPTIEEGLGKRVKKVPVLQLPVHEKPISWKER